MILLLSAEPPPLLPLSTKLLPSINVNINAAWKKRNPIPLRLLLRLVLVIPSLNLSQIPLRQTYSLNPTLPTSVNLAVLSQTLKKPVK